MWNILVKTLFKKKKKVKNVTVFKLLQTIPFRLNYTTLNSNLSYILLSQFILL